MHPRSQVGKNVFYTNGRNITCSPVQGDLFLCLNLAEISQILEGIVDRNGRIKIVETGSKLPGFILDKRALPAGMSI